MRILNDNAPRTQAAFVGRRRGLGWSRRSAAATACLVRGEVCPQVATGVKSTRNGHGMPVFVQDLRHRPTAP
ncbi:MAG: hypothetical protein R3263_02425 [Myxococcota bacterium]|nr:hypothetical protein [Myxococcota bacterium]